MKMNGVDVYLHTTPVLDGGEVKKKPTAYWKDSWAMLRTSLYVIKRYFMHVSITPNYTFTIKMKCIGT
jgi:hypothetical protein